MLQTYHLLHQAKKSLKLTFTKYNIFVLLFGQDIFHTSPDIYLNRSKSTA